MSGLSLPPSHPPAEDVTVLLDRLRAAREHVLDARRQEQMLDQALAEVDQVPIASQDYFHLERRVARNRTLQWVRHIHRLERMARSMGLQP